MFLLRGRGLTDGGEDAREAEIVHRVEGEQVEQKLLPFFLTQQECVGFVQLPAWGKTRPVRMFTFSKIHKY